MNPRRLLVVHASDEAYGADRVLLRLVIELAGRGWEPSVVVPDDTPRGWLSARLDDAGIPVEPAPLAVARRRYLRPLRLPGYLADLWRARRWIRAAARRWDAGVIHVNTSALLVGAFLGRPSGARLVWHVHEIVVRPAVLAWLFRLLPPLAADRVVAVSAAVRSNLVRWRWARSRVVVVHNGLDARATPVAPRPRPEAPLVAYVGRLNRWKGYDVFVDAVGRVAPAHPAARFLVAGDPPAGEEWRSADLVGRLRAAGLTDRVETPGFVADIPALLETVDVAVVPSTWPDPLPTVVLEAMRAGCAVVASAHGGAPEMIEDGVSGLLVPPGDADALATAIGSLLDDPSRRAALGDAAAARIASTFTVNRAVDGMEAVYQGVLAEADRAG